MTIAIIGASGAMGHHLLVPLLSRLGPVLAVSRHSTPEVWAQAWQADAIWLSIPRDAVPELLAGRQLKPSQVVVDICSIKRRLSSVVQPTGAAFLSFHPLNGPQVPLSGQKWVQVDADPKVATHAAAQRILNFLHECDINFLHAASEDEHDFMMGVVLSLPELFTLVIDDLLSDYARANRRAVPQKTTLLEWAVPASNAMYSSVIHAVSSSPEWLREDLITGAHGALLSSAQHAFARLSHLSLPEVAERVRRQRTAIEQLPMAERTRIRQWVERWFVDSNQHVFGFHRRRQHRPNLVIQEAADRTQIFPLQQGRVRIGIHGVAGCFTHESVLRLCEELGVDPAQLDLHYLVEARRVIAATISGEVDRGVFAMANSGSGAYVSSMHAMGEYRFEVLAIYGMEILQCLVAHASIKRMDQVVEVFGHPQAVSQCKRTFAERYPGLKVVSGQDSDDTALCAKRIADGQLPPTTATLASQVAAKIYGLNVLEYGMHHDPFNTTTFLVIRKPATG
ncbi:MAG: prephenate dehydrogenase/arogenate dehydrogenase family protein [bacterium]|nr:prephenate dehydrogenase/arogenate dehydrogenase family protein [bacterium]